jgi:hypothetical protein
MSVTLDDLIGALRGAPKLPDASCRGLWVLFDDIELPDDGLALCALRYRLHAPQES